MKNTELAYLAGVIDSDGTIGIKRSTYAMRVTGDCQAPTYSERICVKQVEPQAIDMLHCLFGGYRFSGNGSSARAKRIQGWQVTDKKAIACLQKIMPYLQIKKQQALNCIALRKIKEQSKKQRVSRGRGHVGAARRSPEHSNAMQSLCDKAHELNKVGI